MHLTGFCDAGTSPDMTHGVWLDNNGGIGASADSFYEYLLKAYILFGGHFLSCRAYRTIIECCDDSTLNLMLLAGQQGVI